MSTSIDYQRKAFFEVDKYGDRVITVLAEIGSSNCFESQTGRRARDWYVNFHGAQYSDRDHDYNSTNLRSVA